MNKRWRTRVLSGALSVAMLASMAPMALAASNDLDDIYTEIDEDGYIDLDDVGGEIYDQANEIFEGYPSYVKFYTSDGWISYDEDGDDDAEGDKIYYAEDEDYFDEYVYFVIDDIDSDAEIEYTVYSDDSDDDALTGTIYVEGDGTSSSSDGDIYADIDSDGYLNMDDIASELYEFADAEMKKDYPSYVEFTSVSNGYLTYGNNDKDAEDVKFYFNDDGDELDEYVYFEIKDDSKEASIDFTVGNDEREKVSGTIVINGESSSSAGDIKYSTGYNTSVTFKGSDFEDLLGNNEDLQYVTFTLPSSSKGTLYTTSSERTEVSRKDEFDADELDEVTFAPKTGTSGSVSIDFKLYYENSRGRDSSKSGTVVISVADGKTITYTAAVDEALEFSASDFEDICDEFSKYDLDYVKFSLPSSSKGTLYAEYDGTSKGSEKASSSDKFYVDPGSKDYALDDVVFVPKASGTIEFSYTAYPTKGSSFSGKVQISVSAGSLPDINYTSRTTTGVTFNGSDFASALKNKSSSATLNYVTFTLPSSNIGTLYYDYNAATGKGTAVSASTQYKNSSSGNSLSKITFVPKSGLTGTVTINYTAKDTRGNVYSGAVKLSIDPGVDKVLTYSSNGRAVTFSNADFRLACTSKLGTTLNYVRFNLPSASQGTLYYGYRSNQETRVSANASYMSNTHLDFISFVPKANYSGTVTITYTGYDVNGNSFTGTIQVQVTQPTTSSFFTDATESWIAPAADFLSSYGVYSGVVSGSTLGVRNQATRGEVMQMIYNAFNLKNKVTSVTSNFTDVPATHPYYTAINAANQLGIALGDQGKFRPDEAITRQDAMTLLYRAFSKLGVPMSTGTASDLMAFGDYAKVDSYATDALASMVKSGIIQGDNGMINPKGNVTRGEISVMLYRAMTL